MANPSFMSKVRQLFNWEKKSAPDLSNSYRDFESYQFSAPSRWSSDTVNYKSEVGSLDGHSLVMCVVNYTGTRLPEAKPTVLIKDKDGKTEGDPLHDLARLIRRPNRHYVWANYCLSISLSWWIDGNVYFLKERDGAGDVIGLWYIPHHLIEPRWYDDRRSPEVPATTSDGEPSSTYLSHYQFNVPNKVPVLYEARDVVHIKRGCDTERRGGVSGFAPLVKELYGDDKMAAFTAAIMRNMGIQVPVIAPKDREVTINATDAQAMKESWMVKTTGARAGEPVILTEPVTVEKFGFSPTELDLSALRMIPESRVAAVLGIPAPTLGLLVGLQNGTSYASSEQARQQGYEEVVIPMQQAIAEEIQWQLLPDFEDTAKTGSEFSFDTTNVRVLQDDADNAMKRAATGYLAGVLKRGDARRIVALETTPEDEMFFDPRGGSLGTGEDDAGANVPAKGFGNVAEIDRYLGYLEMSMKDFVADQG